jgi:hypothetical protein
MMLAKFLQKALYKSSHPLIDSGLSLSNHWSGMASSAMGKKCSLMSSSPPASLMD